MTLQTPKLFHIAPDVHQEDFERGRLKPYSNNMDSFTKALLYNINGIGKNDLTPRQQQGMKTCEEHGHWNLGNPDNVENLLKFLDIFDDLYFGGLLKDYCKVEYVENGTTRQRYGHEFYGRSTIESSTNCWCESIRDSRFKLQHPYATILVEKRGAPRAGGTLNRIQHYMEVLLHEMLHAIYHLYCCHCGNGCLDYYKSWMELGHGEPWLAATLAIEKVDKIVVRNFGGNMDLGRLICFTQDVNRGARVPNDAILRKLELDIDVVRTEMKEHRVWMKEVQEPEARAKKLRRMPQKANRCLRSEMTVDGWEAEFGYEQRQKKERFGHFCLSDRTHALRNESFHHWEDEHDYQIRPGRNRSWSGTRIPRYIYEDPEERHVYEDPEETHIYENSEERYIYEEPEESVSRIREEQPSGRSSRISKVLLRIHDFFRMSVPLGRRKSPQN